MLGFIQFLIIVGVIISTRTQADRWFKGESITPKEYITVYSTKSNGYIMCKKATQTDCGMLLYECLDNGSVHKCIQPNDLITKEIEK